MPDPSRVEFLENHRPALPSGVYEVTVTQRVTGAGIPADTAFVAAERFGVFGERFAVPDEGVVAVFPPTGALGDYADVLPHVVLARSTLPWERLAVATGSDEPTAGERAIPWLALLVFAEDELAPVPNRPLSALRDPAPGWPGAVPEAAQHGDDPVATVEVPLDLLREVLPTAAELRLLAHARRGKDDADQAVGDEWAVVVANRLPAVGATSVAHLVSLEGRFRRGTDGAPPVFDPAGATAGGTVRLVSLRSWRFAVVPDAGRLAELLRGLDRAPVALRLPPGTAAAEPYLERGYLPVPHALRGGAATVSWYHGPLVPPGAGEAPPADLLPARGADALVRFHADTGMFDVGYAAAWELGRLLAMNADRFARALFEWRHQWTHFTAADRYLAQPYLGAPAGAVEPPPLPPAVLDWLARAALLHGVPFNYLVPDERCLPPESLRCFHLDAAWIAALLDGAFALGRLNDTQAEADVLHQPLVEALVRRTVSGALIRSAAVAGWPTLQVEGYDRSLAPDAGPEDTLPDTALRPLLRCERLSANVLLCLWEGEVDTIDLHQPAEALHFGVRQELPTEGADGERWSKPLRNADATPTGFVVDPVPLRRNGRRVVDVAALAAAISEYGPSLGLPGVSAETGLNSAHFALEMVEGVPRVRFRI